MKIKETSTKLHETTYEQFLLMLKEHEGFEYMLANRFHQKHLIDENGVIHYVTFSDEEQIKCAIENIEHYSKKTTLSETKGETEVATYYQGKLQDEKAMLTKMFSDLM